MKRLMSIYFVLLYAVFNNCIQAQQCYFKQVSSKSGHSLGITEDGKLYGWGSNIQGQIGLGTNTISEPTPKLVNQDTDWKKVETGNSSSYSVALKNNGSLWFFGNSSFRADAGFASTVTNYLIPTSITPTFIWKDFSTGYFRIIGLRNDNTLWGWGNNDGGCLGILGNTGQVNTPTQIGIDNDWSKISCGLFHTLALKSNGTLWGCGYNNVGQLGNGMSGNGIFSATFVQIGNDSDWSEILAGAGFCLAIKTDGTLWGWGSNETGQLGNGTTTNSLVPIQIGTDNDWKSLGYSGYSSAAIKNNGSLWTWGLGSNGQLGNGSNVNALVPTQVGTNMDWKLVTGGGGYGFSGLTGDHYLALKQNNELFSWGINQNGSLGNNSSSNKNIPTSICNTVSSVEFGKAEYVSVYPNPANTIINIMSETPVENITITNMFGQEIKKQKNSQQVDISEVECGSYLLKIEILDRQTIIKSILIVR